MPKYHLRNVRYRYVQIIFVWRDSILYFSFLPLSSAYKLWHTDTHTDRQTHTRDTVAFIYRTSSFLASLVGLVHNLII